MLKRVLSIIVLLATTLPSLLSADSCSAPTATLTLGDTLYNQEINQPYIDGDASSGESLYYKVVIPEDGTFDFSTATDGSDTVDTYAYFLDASCNQIAEAGKYQDQPRLVESIQSVRAGETYYIKVENHATSSDSIALAKGFFKLRNLFTRTIPAREIAVTHSGVSSIDSGKTVTYTINVTNTGSEDTTSVKVTDTLAAEMTYKSFSSSADWSCSQSGTDITCDLLSGVISANGGVVQLLITTQADYVDVDTTTNASARVDVDYASGVLNEVANKSVTIKRADVQISLEKSAVASSLTTPITQIIKNNEFDYLLTISNPSTFANSNIIMIDDVPSEFAVQNIDYDVVRWDCAASSGQHVECKLLSDLTAGDSADIRLQVKAIGAISATPYQNSARVTSSTVLATTIDDTDTADMTIVDESYDISFSKTNPDSTVTIDTNTSYTLTVTNNSNMPIDGVRILDIFPSQLVANGVSGASWTCQSIVSNTIDCSYDLNLSVGESASIMISAEAKTVGDDIVNTATVSTNQTPDKTASKRINISAYAPSDLDLYKKSSQDVVLENDSFVYTLQVKNWGASQEDNLSITDTIPADFTVDSNISSGSWSCALSGNTLTCTLPTLASGALSDLIEISVHAPSKITHDYIVSNTAKVTSARNTTGVIASKDVQLMSPDNAIKIHLDSTPNPVYMGESFTYSLFITNNSQKTTSSVTIHDILPADVIFESADSGGWACDYNTSAREITCNTNGEQLTGTTKEIDFHVTAPNYETNVTNSVKVTTDLDPYTREANVTTVVLAKKDALVFSQTDVSKDPVQVDEPFTYEIKVKNSDTGNVSNDINASNVQVSIDLDSNLSVVDINASGWNCTQSALRIECLLNGDLAVGAESPSIMIGAKSSTAHYAITDLNLTSTSQQAGILASIPVDIYSTAKTNLGITLGDDKDPVVAMGDFAYFIEVSNSGSSYVANNIDLTLETTSSDTFIYQGLHGSGWSCSQSGAYLYCHLDTLDANSISSLIIDVKAPDINGTLAVKAIVGSMEVDDIDSSNDSVAEVTQVVKFDKDEDNLRDFTQVLINGNPNTNIYGEVFTIGNQSICEDGKTGVCSEPSEKVNDWVYQTNANLDSKSSYENSTAATLNILDSDEVIWAGLYWMGMIDRNEGDAYKIDRASQVYLRHESENSYLKVESDPLKFNWKNDRSFGVDLFGYQGVSDVTDYVKSHKKGQYWVANVQTTEGENLSAGWSLVVVVQDKTESRKLRNITLFDGFQAVWKNSDYSEADQYPDAIQQRVSGFLTPNNGAVSSKLTLFGVEGDETLDDSIALTDKGGVSQKLNNALNPVDDVVNGTISHDGSIDTQRVPALSNTSGIDIDTFDVSAVIDNAQSTTDITIASEGDRFYLGMFAFSTELYLPKMCYIETMTHDDYSSLSDRNFRLGDKIGFEISLRNDENERARNIVLKAEIDNIFQDTNKTLEIKNVGDSNYGGHNELWESKEINSTNDQNESVPQTLFTIRAGRGADISTGGYMDYHDELFFHYNGRLDGIPDNNKTKNIYKISYEIENMPAVTETTIKKCNDFNQTIYVSQAQPKGFAIVHSGGGIDDDHLYMQVADNNFSVDILALQEDFTTGRVHKGVVRLDLVDVNVSTPEDATQLQKEEICKSFTTRSSHYISIDDANRIAQTLAYHESGKNLGFRIVYPVDRYGDYATWTGVHSNTLNDFKTMLDNSYLTKCQSECAASSTLDACRGCIYNLSDTVSKVTCAKDSFAIRPARIMMDTNETLLRGARDYNLTMEANSTGYNQHFAADSIRYTLQKPVGCTLANANGSVSPNAFGFSDGNASIATFTYNNVGDINVTLLDTTWTLVDQNATDSNSSDCVMGSSANVLDANGKYGCNVGGDKIFSFVASAFKNEVNLQNDHNGTFTYLDNTGTQRARAYMTITALLDNNNTATNYTAGCFAKDINYAFPTTPLVPGKIEHFYADTDMQVVNPALNVFSTSEGNFSAGVTKPVLGINFARSKTVSQNPFDLNSSVLNIAVMDASGVSGNGFVNSTGIAKYYYMRLYAPDYLNIEDSNFTAGLFYEVYCNEDMGCDKSDPNLSTLPESVDHVNWYIFNANHTTTLGKYSAVSVARALNVTNKVTFSMDLNLPLTLGRPYCDRITLTPDEHFRYDSHSATMADKLSFKACFISQGSWAGKGDVGMSVDMNISRKRNSKIDW